MSQGEKYVRFHWDSNMGPSEYSSAQLYITAISTISEQFYIVNIY